MVGYNRRMNRPQGRTIALLTDFGERGIYVGALKGVIATLHPGAAVIDLTHRVTPQAVREGAFLLHCAYRACPPGTVFVAVVDPGVGTARRPIALDIPGAGTFVGPTMASSRRSSTRIPAPRPA